MHNRNIRRKKMLDLRKAFLSGERPALPRLFGRLHPELDTGWRTLCYEREWWDYCWNCEQDWYRQIIGCYAPVYEGNPPADLRRRLNRKRRRYEKQAVEDMWRNGDWGELILPSHRRDSLAKWNLDWY